MKISTQKIAYIALFAAVNVFLNAFTWTQAGLNYAISLTYIPTFLAGLYFGPFAGFLVGFIGDVLGCIIWPKGAWIPLITLASALMGVIPGLVRKIKLDHRILLLISYLSTYVICSMFLNTLGLWLVYAATKKTFWVYMVGRLPIQLPVMLINFTINLLTMPFFERFLAPRAKRANAAS